MNEDIKIRVTKIIFTLLLTGFILGAVFGCTSTPNTDAQWERKYAREDAADYKAWCLSVDGVYSDDDLRGPKCYDRADWNRAVQR